MYHTNSPIIKHKAG